MQPLGGLVKTTYCAESVLNAWELVGIGKLPMNACDQELLDPVTANHSSVF